MEQPYRLAQVRGRIVVDIGAFTGDSAIYFAYRGAKKVIAFEPVQETYRLAIENVKLNGFRNIHIRNEALSMNEGEVFVDSKIQNHHSFSLPSRTSVTGVKVQTCTLSDVVSELGTDEAVLKLDCEGCEYDLLLKSDDQTILRFEQVILEAHSGTGSLVKRLRELEYYVKVMDIKGHEISEEDTRALALLYGSRRQ
ncbi:MAG: FkbM family methyltransferase [Nitrososphaerota archaeon]|nr:FkbM family methyltransferase [Nitrososphaerota archaeon]